MDSSYHIRTNVSVERGIFWCINVYIIHKEGILFFSSVVQLQRSFKNLRYKKGPKAYLSNDSYFVYVVEAFITVK